METLEIVAETRWAEEEREVVLSMRRLFLRSTVIPKWLRKSAPRRGCVTLATRNVHLNSLRRPKSSVQKCSPRTEIREPLAANN